MMTTLLHAAVMLIGPEGLGYKATDAGYQTPSFRSFGNGEAKLPLQ